jgi:hypothetical protein
MFGPALLAGLCFARSVSADEDPFQGKLSVAWDARGSCPDVAHVRAAIASMLGGSTRGHDLTPLTASGAVTEAEGRFRLRIQLDSKGASETKAMDAETCGTLADAFALVVAFTLDPSVGLRPPALADVPRTDATASVPTRREPPASSSPPEVQDTRFLAGPLVALGAGALPFPSVGVGARVAVETGPRWELAGMFWPEQSASVILPSSQIVGANVWLATAQPSACVPFARAVGALCAGGELGAMKANGVGVPVAGSGTSWWLAATAGVALRATLTHAVALRLRLDAGVPVFRPSFVLDNVGGGGPVQAFRPAPVFGVLSFEPEFQLFSTDRREARHVSY